MDRDDQTRTSEQKAPIDVHPTADDQGVAETPVPSTFVKPANGKDENDQPVVNPVTGGAF